MTLDTIPDLIFDRILNLIVYIILAILVKTLATMIALHFQMTTDCGSHALSMTLLVMMIFPTLGFPF